MLGACWWPCAAASGPLGCSRGSSRGPAAEITAVVNTGDDTVLHGLHISPDLDTVTYTLAGMKPRDRLGPGRRELDGHGRARAARRRGLVPPGDRDLATHLFRTRRLAPARPGEVTAELPPAGSRCGSCPVTDDPLRPGSPWPRRASRAGGDRGGIPGLLRAPSPRRGGRGGALRRAPTRPARRPACWRPSATRTDRGVPVEPHRLDRARPGGPGRADALAARRARVVAVSPIVAGAALKGPADRLMAELGNEPSVVGVARIYAVGRARWWWTRPMPPSRRRRGRGRALRRHAHRHEHARARADTWRGRSSMPHGRGRAGLPCRRASARSGPGPTWRRAHRRRCGAGRPRGPRDPDGDVIVVTQKIVSKAEGRLVEVDHGDPGGQAGPRRAGVGAGPAPPGRPRDHRDPPRLRVRQRRGRPVQRGGRRRRCSPRTRTARPGGSVPACSTPRGRARRSSCPTRSAGRGGRASPTWPSGAPGWPPSSTSGAPPTPAGVSSSATEICVADELASAAELVMGKDRGIPVAVVRGVPPEWLRPASVAPR